MSYTKAKSLAIDLVDDFTKQDVAALYGTKFKAATKFEKLGISPPIAAAMPVRINKVMKANYTNGKNIGALDMAGVGTIGDFITLFCACAQEPVPVGEPT